MLGRVVYTLRVLPSAALSCCTDWCKFRVQVREANQMVEEMMLLANISVAQVGFTATTLLLSWSCSPVPWCAHHNTANACGPRSIRLQDGMCLSSDKDQEQLPPSLLQAILAAYPACALLRRHPTPPPRQFEPLLAAASAAGFSLDVSTSRVTFVPRHLHMQRLHVQDLSISSTCDGLCAT